MISSSHPMLLALEAERTAHCLRVKPTIYQAFEDLCEQKGFQRVNDVIEQMMLACVRNEGLFTLLIHGKLEPTRKRRKNGALELEGLQTDLRKAQELKTDAELADAKKQAAELRQKLEELKRKRMETTP